MTDTQSAYIPLDKQEREMVQIELYTEYLDEYSDLFISALKFELIENKSGWRQLRHPAYFDIMLFCPAKNQSGDSHTVLPVADEGGRGIEIVICVRALTGIRDKIIFRGFECSETRYPDWGSAEFFFKLKEGYLIRVKQPREFRS